MALQPELAPGGGGAPGADEGRPGAVVVFAQKEQLHATASIGANAEEAGGHNAGVVQDEEVAGTKEGGEVADVVVAESPGFARDNQEAGRVAGLDRLLGDQLGRQVVVEVRRSHAGSIALSRASV